MGELYKLSFPNGKAYVGKGAGANGARCRFEAHMYHAARPDTNTGKFAVYRAWRKYGAPTLTVLAVIEDNLLGETEIKAIEAFKTRVPDGYNMTIGGEGIVGLIRTPEHSAKIGLKQKGRIKSVKEIAKIRAAMLGRKHTPEARVKIGMASRGISPETRAKIGEGARNRPPEVWAKIIAALKGRPVSLKTRARISAANKLNWLNKSDDERICLRTAQKGRVVPTETCAKMSMAARTRSPEAQANITAAIRAAKDRISASNKGQKRSLEARAKMSVSAKARHAKRRLLCSTG